jgi:hypothetical protein
MKLLKQWKNGDVLLRMYITGSVLFEIENCKN